MSEAKRNRYLLVVELIIIAAVTVGLLLGIGAARGDAYLVTRNWPESQLLPQLETAAPVADCIATESLSSAECRFFTSLQGLVNKTRPRIFISDHFPSSSDAVPAALHLSFQKQEDPYALVDKYREEIKGVVIYDPAQPATIHLATVIAASQRCVLAEASLARRLENQWQIPIIQDLRGQFSQAVDVYRFMLENYAESFTNRLLLGSDPNGTTAYMDYTIAVGAFPVWLNAADPEEKALLEDYMSRMPAGKSAYLGDWPDEEAGLSLASQYGVVCLDGAENLSFYAGLSDHSKETSPNGADVFPAYKAENKLYIALIIGNGGLSEGLNEMPALWTEARNSDLPLSWNLSPALRNAAPALWEYYADTAGSADCFVSPQAGLGNYNPSDWQDRESLTQMLKRTDVYIEKMNYAAAFLPEDLSPLQPSSERPGLLEYYRENLPHLSGYVNDRTSQDLSEALLLSVQNIQSAQELSDICSQAVAAFDGMAPAYLVLHTPLLSMEIYESLTARYPDAQFVTVSDCLALRRGEKASNPLTILPAHIEPRPTVDRSVYDPYAINAADETEEAHSPWRYIGAAAISLLCLSAAILQVFLLERARKHRQA